MKVSTAARLCLETNHIHELSRTDINAGIKWIPRDYWENVNKAAV
jgi:hypothetical protein